MLLIARPASAIPAVLALVLLGAGPVMAQEARNISLLAHLDAYPAYSACWSYVHPDGREYAILGTQNGTSVVNVSNPALSYEAGFISGLSSVWREMKSYRQYVYVSTEADGGGIQIVKMTDPENPVLVRTYATGFNRAHTVSVDTTRALLYCNGTRFGVAQTGLRILSLADPENPVEVGSYTADYVHDSFPSGTRLYLSCIASKHLRVLDVANPAAPVEIASWTYGASATHNAEPSSDGRFLYICDEMTSGTMKIFDIQSLGAPVKMGEFVANPLGIAHNIHVKGNIGYLAYYTEGIRLLDLADPALPAEFGYYDTYPDVSGGYHGAWEVAPHFPSGTFVVSDIESGLYVFRMSPDYGIVKVRVTDPSGAPLSDAEVTSVGQPDLVRTHLSGEARAALAPGAHVLNVSKFSYEPAQWPVTVSVGSSDSFAITLYPAAAAPLSGFVLRAGDAAPIDEAVIELGGSPLVASSGPGGAYSISSVPVGSYPTLCERAGFAPASRVVHVEPGPARIVDWALLPAAWYDSCDTDRGWSLGAAGDDATSGLWTRAEPVGTSADPAPALRGFALQSASWATASEAAQHPEPEEGGVSGPVQPEEDHTPGAGGYCFVTGNGAPGGAAGDADVDDGRTTLVTPPLDLSKLSDPVIGFRRWYFMNAPGEADPFVIDLSPDGVAWMNARTITESHPEWHLELIRVWDYFPPTATVRVRFVAQDVGVGSVVEAGVDDLEFHDASLLPAAAGRPVAPRGPLLALDAPRPNPSRGDASITLRLAAAGPARAAVYDAGGREIARLLEGMTPAGAHRLAWDGRLRDGSAAPAGVYWIRAAAAGASATRKQVLLR